MRVIPETLLTVSPNGRYLSAALICAYLEEDGKCFGLASDDTVLEFTDYMRFSGGSTCGCGVATYAFNWSTVRTVPAGTFKLLSDLPAAIDAERKSREDAGRPVVRFNQRVCGIPQYFFEFHDDLDFEPVYASKSWGDYLKSL